MELCTIKITAHSFGCSLQATLAVEYFTRAPCWLAILHAWAVLAVYVLC
jgi:hypothetical protein